MMPVVHSVIVIRCSVVPPQQSTSGPGNTCGCPTSTLTSSFSFSCNNFPKLDVDITFDNINGIISSGYKNSYNSIDTIEWDFDDSTTDTVDNIADRIYEYVDSGAYNVSLTITDNNANTLVTSFNVEFWCDSQEYTGTYGTSQSVTFKFFPPPTTTFAEFTLVGEGGGTGCWRGWWRWCT